jgi:hypothetical protein
MLKQLNVIKHVKNLEFISQYEVSGSDGGDCERDRLF